MNHATSKAAQKLYMFCMKDWLFHIALLDFGK